jgi:hypothetical protein
VGEILQPKLSSEWASQIKKQKNKEIINNSIDKNEDPTPHPALCAIF